MEYNVRLKNPFSRDQVVALLQGRQIGFPLFGPEILARPYLPGTAVSLFSTVLHLLHRLNAGTPPVYENNDFALYHLSSKGGAERDYYLFDNRCLIYDRRAKWAYWQSPLPTNNHSQILDGPLDNLYSNSPFGKARGGKKHGGTDYPVPGGTPYYATANGKVVRSGFSTTYGNVIIIDHGPAKSQPGNVYTVYAHCSKLLVGVPQKVKTRDIVALTGNTGRVKPAPPKGYHGHYEVICTTDQFGGESFYAFKNKFKPTDLKLLLTGNEVVKA